MCLFGKTVARFVKADMSVVSDAEQLQIDAAERTDQLIVTRAFFGRIRGASVWNKGVFRFYVDRVKEVFSHKTGITSGIIGGKSQIFVEIDGPDPRKVEISHPVPVDQLPVGADRGGTGGKTEYGIRF